MESNRDVTETLRRAERAAAAPFIDHPPTPAWYPPAAGLWAAAFCAATAVPSGSPWRAAALVALVVVVLVFVGWYRRHCGVWPRGRAPREVRAVMTGFVIGAVLVVGGLGAVLWLAGPWIAAPAALAVVWPAVAWYERAYARAARQAKARLG